VVSRPEGFKELRNYLEMRSFIVKKRNVLFLICCLGFTLGGCAHGKAFNDKNAGILRPNADSLVAVQVKDAVLIRLKAEIGRTEKVAYTHRSTSNSYEDGQLRHRKEDSLDFVSQAETVKVEPTGENGAQTFTQTLSVLKKDGNVDLHDFAMPDLGEKLDVTANSMGHILKSGDYPPNSIFYVAPLSIPEKPVSIGDTWTMQASWLSLEEMVPYQLDMVSILKGFWSCGGSQAPDICAEIEVSGDVGFQGPLAQTLQFNSTWHGRIFFAIKAGTVVWSRVDSDERLVADKVRRDVDSCLEAVLIEPKEEALQNLKGSRCEPVKKLATQTAP
jgi:hypothetical protein